MSKTHSSVLLSVSLLAAAAGLLLLPHEVSAAVSEGLSLCTDTLLPTLFPFMILSGVFVRSGLARHIGDKTDRLMTTLFHLPGVCFSALLFGMIGGYPTGAKTTVSLYRSGVCSKDETEHALAFCNNCGPGFLISGIGFGLFQDIRCGILLFAVHILSAIFTGMVLSPPIEGIPRRKLKNPDHNTSIATCFVTSVTDAMASYLNLCAFVLCFSAVLVLVAQSGIPALLAHFLPCSETNGTWFLLGWFEMTGGIFHLTAGSISERFVLISVLAAWGGLSVHCQVISLLQGTDLSPIPYLKGKALHSIFAFLLASAVIAFVPLLPYSIAGIICSIVLGRLKKRSGKTSKRVL